MNWGIVFDLFFLAVHWSFVLLLVSLYSAVKPRKAQVVKSAKTKPNYKVWQQQREYRLLSHSHKLRSDPSYLGHILHLWMPLNEAFTGQLPFSTTSKAWFPLIQTFGLLRGSRTLCCGRVQLQRKLLLYTDSYHENQKICNSQCEHSVSSIRVLVKKFTKLKVERAKSTRYAPFLTNIF